ncbi:NADPH-dependent F420 reductase [Frateuria defendens]|uniref:NADPH-dependent F420 reductase n=1 Tax=Frateuria defendens TaxID=2219559 RepID=UPI00066FEDD5|nr:NAD(P)-binding domain-containing protein [Frateuria defendens]
MSRTDLRSGRSRRSLFSRLAGLALVLLAAAAMPLCAAAAGKPTIGIIGSGQVGGTLGTLWAKAGYKVMFSSRHPEELKDLAASAGPNASTGTVAEAIAQGEVILLAVPYKAEPDIARQYGAQLKGKILIDADNAYPFRDGAIANEARAAGVARYSARAFPGTRFVRAFNSINASTLSGGGGGGTVTAVYSYTDEEAGRVAAELIRAAGCVPQRGSDL